MMIYKDCSRVLAVGEERVTCPTSLPLLATARGEREGGNMEEAGCGGKGKGMAPS